MNRVAIVGVGQTRLGRRNDASTHELVFEAASAALADAGVAISDLDSVIFGSAPDALLGVNQPDQWSVGASGGVDKPFFRVSTGGSSGSSAIAAGYYSIAGGDQDIVLVTAVERVSESSSVQMLMNTNFDPIYEKDFGLNAISCYALATVDHMNRYGTTEEQLAMVSVRNHVHALKNPLAHLQIDPSIEDVLRSRVLCWPVKLLDACPQSDGAVALVLSSEPRTHDLDVQPAWISGIKSYNDGYFLGDREILSWREHLAMASESAYLQAGIRDPIKDLDVVELQNPFTISEVMAVEALGFCSLGDGGSLVEDGFGWEGSGVVVNPSGGVLSANPVGAASAVRVAECALQIMNKAGARQVDGAERALAQCSGGSIQFGTVMVLSR